MAPPRHSSSGDPARQDAHQQVADAVRQRRLERGWTQEQLAERSNVSPATVRKLEAAAPGRYRDLTCTRLCAALDWPPDALDAVRSSRRSGTSATPPPTASASITTGSPATPAARPTPSDPAPRDVTPQGSPRPAPAPREVELAALNGRLAQLDERQWERLLAFVEGLAGDDR